MGLLAAGQDREEAGHQGTSERWRSPAHDGPAGAGELPRKHPEESKVKALSGVRLFATPWTVAHKVLCPWGFPGKSTGVGCHFLRQGIFPTQGSISGLLHCRQTLYRLSLQGSPFSSVLSLRRPLLTKRQRQRRRKN